MMTIACVLYWKAKNKWPFNRDTMTYIVFLGDLLIIEILIQILKTN